MIAGKFQGLDTVENTFKIRVLYTLKSDFVYLLSNSLKDGHSLRISKPLLAIQNCWFQNTEGNRVYDSRLSCIMENIKLILEVISLPP